MGVLYGAIDVDSFSEEVRAIIENEEYYFSIVEQNGDFTYLLSYFQYLLKNHLI